jgi:hypothetical protein
MSNLPANPLAALVAAAARTLPRETGATAAAAADRARPQLRVVLADTSASMSDMAAGRRKIDVLRDALNSIGTEWRIIAFGAHVCEVTGRSLPEPDGSTPLHEAIARASVFGATHLLIISDGHPDNPSAALEAADRLGWARIDVIYCGPDSDRQGMDYMRRLARGGGQANRDDFAQPARLARAVSGLLTAPRAPT